jgi:hypothetical protein
MKPDVVISPEKTWSHCPQQAQVSQRKYKLSHSKIKLTATAKEN